MTRGHRLALSLILGAAALIGVVAVARTVHLGATTQARAARGRDAAIAAQARRLDGVETALHRALARRPPRLPAVPRFKDPAPPPAVAVPAQAAPRRVVYVRPPPRVVRVHRPGGGGEGDDRGEGGDD